MTRAKWVALAVGLAVVVTLGLAKSGESLWTRCTYVDVPPISVTYTMPRKTWSALLCWIAKGSVYVGTGRWIESGFLRVKKKRASWLPGPDFIVPDQVCASCSHGRLYDRHYGCYGAIYGDFMRARRRNESRAT